MGVCKLHADFVEVGGFLFGELDVPAVELLFAEFFDDFALDGGLGEVVLGGLHTLLLGLHLGHEGHGLALDGEHKSPVTGKKCHIDLSDEAVGAEVMVGGGGAVVEGFELIGEGGEGGGLHGEESLALLLLALALGE
jgi:hypothetical protein